MAELTPKRRQLAAAWMGGVSVLAAGADEICLANDLAAAVPGFDADEARRMARTFRTLADKLDDLAVGTVPGNIQDLVTKARARRV